MLIFAKVRFQPTVETTARPPRPSSHPILAPHFALFSGVTLTLFIGHYSTHLRGGVLTQYSLVLVSVVVGMILGGSPRKKNLSAGPQTCFVFNLLAWISLISPPLLYSLFWMPYAYHLAVVIVGLSIGLVTKLIARCDLVRSFSSATVISAIFLSVFVYPLGPLKFASVLGILNASFCLMEFRSMQRTWLRWDFLSSVSLLASTAFLFFSEPIRRMLELKVFHLEFLR